MKTLLIVLLFVSTTSYNIFLNYIPNYPVWCEIINHGDLSDIAINDKQLKKSFKKNKIEYISKSDAVLLFQNEYQKIFFNSSNASEFYTKPPPSGKEALELYKKIQPTSKKWILDIFYSNKLIDSIGISSLYYSVSKTDTVKISINNLNKQDNIQFIEKVIDSCKTLGLTK